jgi:hypothetical protein
MNDPAAMLIAMVLSAFSGSIVTSLLWWAL